MPQFLSDGAPNIITVDEQSKDVQHFESIVSITGFMMNGTNILKEV